MLVTLSLALLPLSRSCDLIALISIHGISSMTMSSIESDYVEFGFDSVIGVGILLLLFGATSSAHGGVVSDTR